MRQVLHFWPVIVVLIGILLRGSLWRIFDIFSLEISKDIQLFPIQGFLHFFRFISFLDMFFALLLTWDKSDFFISQSTITWVACTVFIVIGFVMGSTIAHLIGKKVDHDR